MSPEQTTLIQAEEPQMCTKKEKIGHAIGVLGHDSMYTMLTLQWDSLRTRPKASGGVSVHGFCAPVHYSASAPY